MNLIPTMNNTKKNILLMAAITSLFIIGTIIIPQSYAAEHKKTGDFKSSLKASTEVDKKSASQHQDKDNFCYRGDDCEQANQEQQIVGKDNEAKGFNDQSKNVQEQALSPTSTQPPNQNATQPPKTCPECFRSILGPQQLDALDKVFEGDAILGTCNRGIPVGEEQFREDNRLAGIDMDTVNALIACLKAAGIVFI